MNTPFRILAILTALPALSLSNGSLPVLSIAEAPLTVMSAMAQSPATPANGMTVRVDDSIAGLGLDVAVEAGAAMDRVDVVVIPPTQNFLVFPLTLDRSGAGHCRVPGTSAEAAGTYSVFVGKNGMRLSTETTFAVLPEGPDPEASTLTVKTDNGTAAVTVTVMDRYGNPLPGRPVELRATPAGAVIQVESKETDDQGTMHFTVTGMRGTVTLRAVDLLSGMALAQAGTVESDPSDSAISRAGVASVPTNAVGGTSPFAAQLLPVAAAADAEFGIVDHFEVTLSDTTLKVNDITGITIRAVDAAGNTAQDYTGTVRITSTDAQATLPGLSDLDGVGQATFTSRHLGVRFIPFSVSFKAVGKQTVTVKDDTDSAHMIRGEAKVAVTSTSGPSVQHLTIVSPKQNSTMNGVSVMVEGEGQPFTNIQVKGGAQPAVGDSDEYGRFAIPVALDANHSEYTLIVMDDVGGEATLHLVRDTDPPVLASATLSPQQPQEGGSILLVVRSEPLLQDVHLQMGTEKILLPEDAARPGTYQALFNAPRAGEYQPAVSATDNAGNTATLLLPLTVTPKKLPVVSNLRAEPKNGAVTLHWDPVEGEAVDFYRVYVGEHAGEFTSTLDTPDASQPAATVTGLMAGTTYVFAVTVVQGSRESDKGQSVSAVALGLRLAVTPETEALNVEWSFPVNITLKSFLVEYGVEQDRLTEKRTVPGGDIKTGEKRSIVLRDLLPGIIYFVRITPVDTAGNARDDLTATGQGTPTGAGIHYTAPDQLPAFSNEPALRPSAQIPSGFPHVGWWGIGAAGAFLLFLQWQNRRKLRKARRFFAAMEAQYRG